jgi:hypothetical protein
MNYFRPANPTTGYIAVSGTLLTGIVGYPDCERAFQWLHQHEPTAKIGYSIFANYIPSTERLPPAVTLNCKAPWPWVNPPWFR